MKKYFAIVAVLFISLIFVGCGKQDHVATRHEVNGKVISSTKVIDERGNEGWYSVVELKDIDIANFNKLYAIKTNYELKHQDKEQFISMGYVGQEFLNDTYILRIAPTTE